MLGYVIGNEIEFLSQSLKPHTYQTEFSLADFSENDSLPRVDIIYAHINDDGILIKSTLDHGAKGLIHVGTGHGSISHNVETALNETKKAGCIIVRASRVGRVLC